MIAPLQSIDAPRHVGCWQRPQAAARVSLATACGQCFRSRNRACAVASTSCSACASMSAAITRASPSAARIRISVGPATKVDADFSRQQLLRRRDIYISRPDNSIHARHRLRAISHRGDGLCAAHTKHLLNPEQVRASQNFHRWVSATRCTMSWHASRLARGQPSSAASKAADSGPKEHSSPPRRAAARSAPASARC